MTDFLHRQDDPTAQLQVLSQGLVSTVEEQGAQNFVRMAAPIEDCENRLLPALEVELIITRLLFFAVSRKNDHDAELDALAVYKRATELCSRFPDTAGKFFRNLRLAKRSVDGLEAPQSAFAAEPKESWKKWLRHVTGHWTLCNYGHPYSSVTFEACPECGREAASAPVDYEKYLNKDAFLQAMERRAEASG